MVHLIKLEIWHVAHTVLFICRKKFPKPTQTLFLFLILKFFYKFLQTKLKVVEEKCNSLSKLR